MFLLTFDGLCAIGKSFQVKLPKKGLKLDTRANQSRRIRFSIHYHYDDVTVTLSRTEDIGIDSDYSRDKISMRIYDPETETVPDFTSTIYTYWGLDEELAPLDTTLILIHPSVKTIQSMAFYNCKKLRRVIFNPNLEIIEDSAFNNCYALDAVFLPSSIKAIHETAFHGCYNMRILSPFHTVNYMHQLHKECLNTNVSQQSISQCIQTYGTACAYDTDYGFIRRFVDDKCLGIVHDYDKRDSYTPMHILTLNPHATTTTFITLFHANMGVVFETYTPRQLDIDKLNVIHEKNIHSSEIGGMMLLECMSEYNVDCFISIILALCSHKENLTNTNIQICHNNKKLKIN